MECRKIKASLVSLLEDQLTGEQRTQMEQHLEICPACSRLFQEFSLLWGELEHPDRIQPSPFFWTRLQQSLIEYEGRRKSGWGWLQKLARKARPAIALAAVLACVFLGYSLGSFPRQANGQTASGPDQHAVALRQFLESYHLDEVSAGFMEATYQELISEE
jgi:predicted anti-sigma-YlaC factor YlaD